MAATPPATPSGNTWANQPTPSQPAGVPGSHGGSAKPKFGSPQWRAMYDKKK